MIADGTELTRFAFSFNPEFQLDLMGKHGVGGLLWIGNSSTPDAVLNMSFVVETVENDLLPSSNEDEDQVWYQQSSASLLRQVQRITGLKIREITRAEEKQMQVYRYYPKGKFFNLKIQVLETLKVFH